MAKINPYLNFDGSSEEVMTHNLQKPHFFKIIFKKAI